MQKNVIEQIRTSTKGQADEDRFGIPAQKAINRATAAAHGLRIVKTISIVDVSGAHVLCSPQMQDLLQLIGDPNIDGVVTKEFSRLMRPENFADYAILQRFAETGTALYLPDGVLDLSSESGKLLGPIRATFAGAERRQIIKRMMDAKEAMRRAGKHPNGPITVPYGVAHTKKDGWSYTPEIEKVKQIFALFGSGTAGYAEIARRLNLARPNVSYILKNRIYTGLRVYDKRCDPSPDGYVARPDGRQGWRKKIKRAPEDVISMQVLPPAIGQEEFERVQEMMELKRQKHWHFNPPNRFNYNPFLFCGDCPNVLYTHASRQDFYVCKSHNARERKKGVKSCPNKYMLREKLEPKLDQLFGEKLLERNFLLALVEGYNDAQRAAPTAGIDAQAVRAKLDALAEKRQRILDGFFEGVVGKEERDQRFEGVSREVAVYRNLLLESVPEPRPATLDLDTVRALIEPLAEWEFLERRDRRALLAALCPEITVSRYVVKSLKLNLNLADRYTDSQFPREP